MLEYIYFVKCPGCDDEHFYFFNEAREFAMSLLSKKPIITQIEVNRNDFGECTDSCDLGTVWSWEDVMDKETAAEPAKSIFTKDDLERISNEEDPEFDALDNSLDFTPIVPKKPVPSDMSIQDLVEAMEANEDTVECAGCEELFPKDDCFHKEGIGWLCSDCEDSVVRCTWCEELFDRSECRKEVDMGWLCGHCQAAIMSRGEQLTFRENTYWDFLDEDIEKPIDEALEWHTYKITFTTKANPNNEQTTTFKTWQSDVEYAWRKSNNNIPHTTIKKIELVENLREDIAPHDLVELEYPSLTVTLYGEKRDVDDWDEFEHTDSHVFLVSKVEVATAIWENWITDEDAKDVAGGLETLEDDIAWEKFLETHFDILFEKYKSQILEYFKDEATEDFRERSQEEYQLNNLTANADRAYDEWRDEKYFGESKTTQKPFLEEFDDAEAHKASLTDCPECGAVSYDMKEQYCSNCGLGL